MKKLYRPATIAALLAFSRLGGHEQGDMLEAVNQYLLASPAQKRSMTTIWQDEAVQNGLQVREERPTPDAGFPGGSK